VRRYLDCGLYENGFARIRCPDCAEEYLLAFSCKTRELCPSCGSEMKVIAFIIEHDVVDAIPVLTLSGRLGAAAWFVGIVLLEVLVLAVTRWTCPLTPVGARFTDDRRDNFDIFLPEWLARHNKTVFGGLYLAGVALLLAAWIARG
jgi:uncharacterized protein (DUF983 family)